MTGFEFVASFAPTLAFAGRDRAARVPELASPCWNDAVSGLEISPGVRIWYVPHLPWHDATGHEDALTADDISEFAPIRDAGKLHRSLTVRAVLRSALSEIVQQRVPPQAWRFGRSETDKPSLLGPETAYFSCSHTEWASIIVVSAQHDVGIDIERLVIPATEQWMADTFTIGEQRSLNGLRPADRDWAISRLWTLKEAYVKVLGTGIAGALDVAFDPRSARLVSGQQDRRRATFKTWVVTCLGQPLSVAVAICDPATKGASWRQSIEGCLVRLRAKFISSGRRTDKGTALAAPLLRGAGAPQA